MRKPECSVCDAIKEHRYNSRCNACTAEAMRKYRALGTVHDKRRHHRKEGDAVCTCGAYKHPHRQFSKLCKPQKWVERFYQADRNDCADCIHRDGFECQVVTGVEATFHCPALREYVKYEGIVLYGRAREAYDRSHGK